MLDGVKIRSAELDGVEVAWFSALCGDDYEFLGVPDGALRSSWEHCRQIVQNADRLGYRNILLPNSYVPGQDTLTFAGGVAPLVRQSEEEARSAARRLVSKLDDQTGRRIKHRAQDSRSAGVLRQDALREQADAEGYIEPFVWSGIGRARSGCGSAIVGDPDQVTKKIHRYIDMGMRSFILSGYPHLEECELFARYVLPQLQTCCLARERGRILDNPVTPLTTAPRR